MNPRNSKSGLEDATVNDFESEIKDKTLPRLEKYLKVRDDEERPALMKASKIIGVDFHLPLLAVMQTMSLGLLLLVMALNIKLNSDSSIIKMLDENLLNFGWSENIYINSLFIMGLAILIAWGYNFINNFPLRLLKQETIRVLRVIYVIMVLLILFITIISYLPFQGAVGLLLFILLIVNSPILFGTVGILIKNRNFAILAFIGIIGLAMTDINSTDELLEIVLFSAILLMYLEVSDSTIKFSKIYSGLIPERDENDLRLIKDTITQYLFILVQFIGLTVLATLLIFNLQSWLAPVLPPGIVNSLEFNSPIFLFLPIFILAGALILLRWLNTHGFKINALQKN